MKVYKIRNARGEKLTEAKLEQLASVIYRKLKAAGFITDVERVGLSGLRIGLHMKCFVVDTDMHGYNARMPYVNRYVGTIDTTGSVVGFKRTNIPTWDQRVAFNNILNDVLSTYRVSATIKSGPFTVRDGLTVYTERDWLAEANYNQVEQIVTLTPEMEAEARTKRLAYRREQARKRRADTNTGVYKIDDKDGD